MRIGPHFIIIDTETNLEVARLQPTPFLREAEKTALEMANSHAAFELLEEIKYEINRMEMAADAPVHTLLKSITTLINSTRPKGPDHGRPKLRLTAKDGHEAVV